DLKSSIDDILSVLEAKKFGKIDRKTILRTIAAASDLGFAIADIDNLRQRDTTQLRVAVDAVERAARIAVAFLATQIRVPTADALPYLNQFAVLVEIFRRMPSPGARQYEAITKWFWRTALSGHFGGWNTGQMATDRQAVADFAAGATREIEVPSLP